MADPTTNLPFLNLVYFNRYHVYIEREQSKYAKIV